MLVSPRSAAGSDTTLLAEATEHLNGGASCSVAVEKNRPQRWISVHMPEGLEHYPIANAERTSVPDTYRLHIDSRAGAWLPVSEYGVTYDWDFFEAHRTGIKSYE